MVNPHVQAAQNMVPKGGRGCFRPSVNGSYLVALIQPKHGQNYTAATFRQKGVWSQIQIHHLTFLWPIPIFLFLSYGPKNKKFLFLTDFLVRPQKKFRALVRPILMSPTFHIANLNQYTPKFSGYPKSWPGVIGLASTTLQSQHFQKARVRFLSLLFSTLFPTMVKTLVFSDLWH